MCLVLSNQKTDVSFAVVTVQFISPDDVSVMHSLVDNMFVFYLTDLACEQLLTIVI